MAIYPGCGCGSYWNNFPASVCGTWETPTVEDLGQCSPRRVKLTCEAPVLPVAQCADESYEVIYDPTNIDNPFSISATLFDECCLPITDENSEPITLIINQMGGYASGICP